MKKITSFLLAFFLITSFNGFSQELIPVNFNSKVSNSQLIVEGKVISKRSFWDDNNYNIYTASKIEVYKIFKGNINSNFIEIITPGGIVGLHKEDVHPSLELENSDVGIFMLHNNTIATNSINNIPLYQPYASVQGFVKYDLTENKAASVFDKFNNIDQVLYNTITGLTNHNYTVVKSYSVKQTNNSTNKAAPTISNFTPTTVTAGTATQITINGSNFGASTGTVSFSDANDGGSTFYPALPTQIISWNNTQIVVEVPSRAGTGPIRVTNTDPASVNSASSLTVSYSELNAEFDPGTGTEAYPTQHIDRNTTGGYVWQMHTDFDANASERASFMRAFDSWTSCSGTKINWSIGAVTATDIVANDNINIIRDDNGGELPVGVLGRCTSRWSGCGGPTIKWYVEELDIVFDDGTNWNYGPAAPSGAEYDFETVAVHELGHGHQLGHVISPGAIMHFSVSNGTQNRTLGINDLAAGNDVMSRSTTNAVCGEGLMTALPCGAPPVANFSGTPTTLCEGATVSFTDLSTNTPTGWSWSFPGGTPSTSNAQNPTITYSSAGTYNVTLTATNASGSDPETKTGYITVNSCGSPPVANFSATPTTLCEGNTVSFTDLSTNTPTGWSWSFPGGTPSTSNAQNPTITYATAGSYNVTLTATNAFGSDPETKTAFITVNSCGTTKLRNSDCGIVMTSYLNFIICDQVPPATEYEYEFVNVSLGYNQTVIRQQSHRFIYVNQVPGILDNTTYDVRVRAKVGGNYGSYGVVCQITTPPAPITTQLRSSDCGISMTSYNDFIMCDYVSNATEYEYEFVNVGLGYNQTIVRPNPNYRFVYVHQVPGILDNTTYDVRVRAKINGVYTSYGAVCQISTPNGVTTKLINSDCGITMSSYSNFINCDYVSGATEYEYEFVNVGLGYNQTLVRTNPTYRFLYVNSMPGIQLSTTYDVRVRAKVGGNFTSYGTVCQVTTPATARIEIPFDENNPSTINENTNLELVIYPNPNEGYSMNVDLIGYGNETQLYIIDISGKIIQQQAIDSGVSTIRFNEKLKAGFYFITVVSDNNKITKKLVVK